MLLPSVMVVQVFPIKSLWVQDVLLAVCLAAAVALLIRAVFRKNGRHAVLFLGWICLILWFFNSGFFGFSEVVVGPHAIRLKYGRFSFRNAVVSLDATWEIETRTSGIRKMKRVHVLWVDRHRSMRVRGEEGRRLLERIGRAIEEAGASVQQPAE